MTHSGLCIHSYTFISAEPHDPPHKRCFCGDPGGTRGKEKRRDRRGARRAKKDEFFAEAKNSYSLSETRMKGAVLTRDRGPRKSIFCGVMIRGRRCSFFASAKKLPLLWGSGGFPRLCVLCASPLARSPGVPAKASFVGWVVRLCADEGVGL